MLLNKLTKAVFEIRCQVITEETGNSHQLKNIEEHSSKAQNEQQQNEENASTQLIIS